MTEEKELTEITKEILERTNDLNKGIEKSMVPGEVSIIRGINIFKAIIKDINPIEINEEEIAKIHKYVDTYMINKEEMTQNVNHRFHQGIILCFSMLDSFNKEIKRKTLKNNENIDI